MLTLNLVETHTCPICGKDSVSSQALSTHLVTHSDARPYRCNEKDCGKTFKTADSLSEFPVIQSSLEKTRFSDGAPIVPPVIRWYEAY